MPSAGRQQAIIGLVLVAVVFARGLVAGITPLSYDEAYYWLWSKTLAAGYYDHPPAIAFVIRAGTVLFGDTSLGVRLVPWLLSIAASWAVFRAGTILLDTQAGALSALIFNLMPMIGVESLVATPDAPAIAASAFVLFALAKIADGGRAAWWLAVGIAAGFALLSKYTGFFLGAGILLWLVAIPKKRHWFQSVWPYLGAAIALCMFLPVVIWNAQHDWISLGLQFGRVGGGDFTLRFLAEFLAAQLGFATPFLALLGVSELFRARRSILLIAAMLAPAALYFLWHSLHARVQGNWPSFLYPFFALAIAAAYVRASHESSSVFAWTRRLAIPTAAVMLALVYAQAVAGIVPRVRDPISRLLGYNMDSVAAELETLRVRTGATTILTTSYALTGWLSFYLPSHSPVVQWNERARYLNEPPPPVNLFMGPLLYVTLKRNDESALLAERFALVTPLGEIARSRNGAVLDEYAVYSVEGLSGAALDQGR